MFYLLSKLFDVFLSPFSWGLVLLAAAVPWRAHATVRWKRKRALGAVGLGIMVVSSSFPVANSLSSSLEQAAKSTYRDDVIYDAVVLLGGVVDEEAAALSRQPSYNDNVERVVMTHKLLRDGKARVAIISGAGVDPRFAEFAEAPLLARQLEEWGIAKQRIIIEDRARNTRENALYTQEIARTRGFERVLVVTSAFHMPRAAECYAAVGMNVDTLAVDYRAHEQVTRLAEWLPRATSMMITTSVLREVAGRWIYRAQGYGRAAR